MEEKEFIDLARKQSIHIIKNDVDKHFIFYLSNIHVFITSMILKDFNHLNQEDRHDLGLYDDVYDAFESVSRYDQKLGFLFNLANVTFNLKQALIVEAFNEALKAFERVYKFDDKKDKIDYFKENTEQIVQSIQTEYETEKFFELYENIAKNFSLQQKEKALLLQDITKNFDDLVVFDVLELIKNFEEEALEFKDKYN